MPEDRELVVYVRDGFCPDISRARRALESWRVPYREINIRQEQARQRCMEWNNCLAMPVVVVARPGEDVPIEPPTPLQAGASPRDVDRGSIISEASEKGLRVFLARHGFPVPAEGQRCKRER